MTKVLEAAKERGPVAVAKIRSNKKFDWYFQPPLRADGDDLYLAAFWDLDTERSIGMGLGPIPRHQIRDRGLELGLEPDTLEAFVYVIRQMDNAYLKHESARLKADAEAPSRGGKS